MRVHMDCNGCQEKVKNALQKLKGMSIIIRAYMINVFLERKITACDQVEPTTIYNQEEQCEIHFKVAFHLHMTLPLYLNIFLRRSYGLTWIFKGLLSLLLFFLFFFRCGRRWHRHELAEGDGHRMGRAEEGPENGTKDGTESRAMAVTVQSSRVPKPLPTTTSPL